MKPPDWMKRQARGTAAGLLAIALLGAACGGGSDAGQARAQGAGGTTSPTTVAAAGSDRPLAGGTLDATATPFPSSTGVAQAEKRRCIGVRFVSPARGEPGGTRIWAQPGVVQGWRCGNIVPGRECLIGWNGSYAGTTNENYIRFVAWERGRHEPVTTMVVGPLPLEGQFTASSTKFSYVVGKTDKVRFYLQLLDINKVAIATSDTYVYNVQCKG